MGAEHQILFDLLHVFADLRRIGCSRSEAWEFTHQKALARTDRTGLNQLRNFVVEWEKVEGYKYLPHRNAVDAQKPTPNPILAFPSSPQPNVENVSIRHFKQEPGMTGIVEDTFSTDALNEDNSLTTPGYFPSNSQLLVHIHNHSIPLVFSPADGQELIVGRFVEKAAVRPDIDLGQFGGEKHGVSRMHAAISRNGTILVISDLGSRNHTAVNGLRLRPQQIRVLNHNDKIYFGSLPVRVEFDRAS